LQVNNTFTNNNKLFTKISWLSASSMIKYIAQFVSIILFANKLSVDDYGTYQHVWIVINLFCTLIPFGLTTLLLSANTGAVKNWILTNKKSIISLSILSLFALLLYLFVAMKGLVQTEKIFLFILIIFQILAFAGESILVKQAKEKSLFWINTIYFIAYFLLHYFIVIKYYSLATLLLGLIIITIVKSFFSFMLKNRTEKYFSEENNIKSEWIYLGTNDVLNVVVKWLDKWIILLLWPTASFAIYFNGTYEIPIFLLLLGAVGSVSVVEISKLKIENKNAILQIFKEPILWLATIALPSFAFLYFNAAYLFKYLFANKYNESVPIFIITLFLIPARVVYSTSVLQAFGKSKIIVQGVLLDLILAIIFMSTLYPILGQKGFALAFVLSTYLQILYYLWHTSNLLQQKITNLVPFLPIMLILIISIVISGSVFVLTSKFEPLTAIIINSIACIANMILVYFVYVKAKRN
jgi:O-antigen/teichoic acid export membrane protein